MPLNEPFSADFDPLTDFLSESMFLERNLGKIADSLSVQQAKIRSLIMNISNVERKGKCCLKNSGEAILRSMPFFLYMCGFIYMDSDSLKLCAESLSIPAFPA